jgi:streptomycin 6-kinase
MKGVNLPAAFVRNIRDTLGAQGASYLAGLPALITEAADKWGLTDIEPLPDLSYNFVARAGRGGEAVVLKVGLPVPELAGEIAALRIYDGQGAVRLLDADESRGLMLLEQLRPGRMLSTLEDDEEATRIAAEIMSRLWRPAPAAVGLIQLSDWFKGFGALRSRFEGGTGPLDTDVVERAERAVTDFFAEDYTPTLIHGDFHHFNVLSSERGWLAIDPKGVVGPAGYEVGPLLINPWDEFLSRPDPVRLTERRIAILAERLGFERERIRAWGLAHAVLSAWWSMEDTGRGWEYSLDCARVIARARVN